MAQEFKFVKKARVEQGGLGNTWTMIHSYAFGFEQKSVTLSLCLNWTKNLVVFGGYILDFLLNSQCHFINKTDLIGV